MNWIEAIAHHYKEGRSFVVVTPIQCKGSTPRGTDAKLVVTTHTSEDTIGGGQLEFTAIKTARELLVLNQQSSITKTYNLSRDFQQCCGGSVKLLYECFPTSAFQIIVFGAGHVGQAVVKILGEIPCKVQWVDSRADCIRDVDAPNVSSIVLQNPELIISSCKPGCYYLIMTHDHNLDQLLCETILSKGDSSFCGLIASESKATSFRGRLTRQGFTNKELDHLTAPIGLVGITGKTPMEIAISIVSQILLLKNSLSN